MRLLLAISFALLAVVKLSDGQAAEFGQCGGSGWTGAKTCVSGCTCTFVNAYYSQCLKGSGGATTTTTTTKAAGTTTTTKASGATTTTAGGSSSGLPQFDKAKFPFTKFQVGRHLNWENLNYNTPDTSIIAIWLGNENKPFNKDWEGKAATDAFNNNKQLYLYGYVTAFMARVDWNLHDCDVDPVNNLCKRGAEFITKNQDKIVAKYADYAKNFASLTSRNLPAIFLIEPDFYQYWEKSRDNHQNVKLTGTYMRGFLDKIVAGIQAHLPNARFSFDISAWALNYPEWWSFFKTAPYIHFVSTSGGQARADANIKPGELSYKEVCSITGKRIIADCGYGVAGGYSDNCGNWLDKTKHDARIKDGVVALIQGNLNNNYKSFGYFPTLP